MIQSIFLSVVLFGAACTSSARAADLKLADPFGDEMVLQQGMQVPVWGTADAGANVTVTFAGQTKAVAANAGGYWKVELAPLVASFENRTLSVTDGKTRLEVKDVVVGEVWMCSGQSNMEMTVSMAADAKKEIAAANFPAIRLRVTTHKVAEQPTEMIDAGPWRVCTPANIVQDGTTWKGFSAAAYYFGRDIHREIKMPVGLIEASWGGTYIQPWTPQEGFRSQPKLAAESAALDKDYAAGKGALKLKPPVPGHSPTQPTTMYNAMIAPWTGFPVRGVIWYQGESSYYNHDGPLYADRMAALVSGWRHAWGRSDADFPFYFVQIASYSYAKTPPTPPRPEEIGPFWEAQQRAARDIPNTGMVHTQDVGEVGNIHPHRKQEVGSRLARLALARTYRAKSQAGKAITDDTGPEFKALEAKGNTLIVTFAYAKSGLASRDGKPLSHFEIAGDDHVFAPAEAQIAGSTVILKSATVPMPVEMRFGWSDSAMPNLMNGDKLPAATFHATTKP